LFNALFRLEIHLDPKMIVGHVLIRPPRKCDMTPSLENKATVDQRIERLKRLVYSPAVPVVSLFRPMSLILG
jgi:hypothetical protein